MARTNHYVSPSGGNKILTFKYDASDASLYYAYFISPLAALCVSHVFPPWLAPNTITIFGLSLVASSHIWMALACPDMDTEVSSLCYAWCAVSLFIYQVLDAADGKQARKTGNASPLGLIFDHGCDALNVVLSACTIASAMLMGSTYLSMFILLFPSLVFFMATFEEYFTGTLTLPIVNGPNEGLAVMCGIYAYTALYGPSFWLQPSFIQPEIPNNAMFVIATAFGALFTVAGNVGNVFFTLRSRGESVLFPMLTGLLPYLCLLALYAAWVWFSPTDIVVTHIRFLMWTCGLLFCKLVMHMMLAHLCDEPINLIRKTLVVIFVVVHFAVAGFVPYAHEIAVCLLFFGLSLMVYTHMVYYTISELCDVLKIDCFTVKPVKKE